MSGHVSWAQVFRPGRRAALESAAAAPPWYLDGLAPSIREFEALAARGAALLGHFGGDAWLVWLDRLLEAAVHDGRLVCDAEDTRSTLISDLIATSAAYCQQLEAGASATSAATDATPPASTRRERVNAFIRRVYDAQRCTPTRRNIWRNAGYSSSTDFEQWQRNDPRTTKRAAENFERVLSDPAALKRHRR